MASVLSQGSQRSTRDWFFVTTKGVQKKEKWRRAEVFDDEARWEKEQFIRRCTGMTEENVLNSLWDVRAHVWKVWFQELNKFVAVNSHVVIREQKGGTYMILWPDGHQRKDYRRHQSDGHTTLAEEKLLKLNSIGFPWNTEHERQTTSVKRQSHGKR